MSVRPPALRRCWLFLPGADEAALAAGAASGADVLIQELEDFTPPAQRPAARALAPALYEAWRQGGAVTAVRINPLASGGLDDLDAVMRGRPDVVLMPKVATAGEIVALDAAVGRAERAHGIPVGATELVPNIETAHGLINAVAIAKASRRVTALAGSTEDMAADLGAERRPDAVELAAARTALLLAARAVGTGAVDAPYTFADEAGCRAEAMMARRLGYAAKSAVLAAHVPVVQAAMTPGADELALAERRIAAFEAARAEGRDRALVDDLMVEVPMYQNALRLRRRAAALAAWERRA